MKVRRDGAADCGHNCCDVRDNLYHVHVEPPETCRSCPSGRHEMAGDERGHVVGAVVRTVLAAMAPEIPGVTEDVVVIQALDACGIAVADPQLFGIPVDEWRRIVATRVGLALAFPHG